MKRFYSMDGEDRWIFEYLAPKPGIYCEVGAGNGLTDSNTAAFELSDWKGFLVEPVPSLAADCLMNRAAITWCCAAGYRGLDKFYVNHKDPQLSGLKAPGAAIHVPVVPLFDLIHASGFDYVDLLSIDTEGTELEVWDSLGVLTSIRLPKIVIIEYQTRQEPPQDRRILERLCPLGYQEVRRTRYNLILHRPL